MSTADIMLEMARVAHTRGQPQQAVELIQRVLYTEPKNQQAWLLLAEVSPDPAQRTQALERVIAINPQNEAGLQAAAALQAMPTPEPVLAATAAEAAPAEPPAPAKQEPPAPPPPPQKKGPAIREGRWDCKYCGSTGIRGSSIACPACGHVRDKDVKFYLPEESEEVLDARLLERARAGVDWLCAFCGTSNTATTENCRQCGASHEDSNQKQIERTYTMDQVPRSAKAAATPAPAPAPVAAPKRGGPPIIAIIAVILLFLVGLGAWLVWPRTAEMAVIGYSWERTAAIEEFQTVVEEGWDVPSGGRTLRQRQEVFGYTQVLAGYETRTREVSERVQVGTETYTCGQRDLGNGFFEDVECNRPIYETRYRTETYEEPIYNAVPILRPYYTYEIDRWVVVDTRRSAGSNHNAQWPDTSLREGQRAGRRTERYVVVLENGQRKRFDVEVTQAQWDRLSEGQRVNVQVDAFGAPSAIEE